MDIIKFFLNFLGMLILGFSPVWAASAFSLFVMALAFTLVSGDTGLVSFGIVSFVVFILATIASFFCYGPIYTHSNHKNK